MSMRYVLMTVLVVLNALCASITARAEDLPWRSIISLTTESKYAGHFSHYDYVNPQAPKGGTLNRVEQGSFDSFNPYINSGTVPAPGLAPFGGGLLYETLMDQSLEEDGISYPSIAEAMQEPQDHSWARFKLNPKARWHDGLPITPEDVVWSFNMLSKYSSMYRSYYAAVDRAEVTGEHEVTFFFKYAHNRELPHIMSDLVVLPKHWWEGTDGKGKKRDFTRPSLEIPLGSGPYRIESFAPGQNIVWRRVPDAWGRDLPQNVGRYNFDRIKYTYLLDSNALWEAFKKGGLADYRQETTVQKWVLNYNFPAVQTGKVRKMSFAPPAGYFQAYYFNTRRAQFADARVRKALTLAMDFESMNRQLFFGQYIRLNSYYGNPETSATGLPEGREREILDMVRGQVPPALFSEPFQLPVYRTPQDTRKYLSQAMELLRQAGWRLDNNRLVDKAGRPLTMEFLVRPGLERPTLFYSSNLQRLGITATVRTVDSSQYQTRLGSFDFDVVFEVSGQSVSPGNEQQGFFGSEFADTPYSRNYSGVKNPAVDKLISHLLRAQTYADVAASARAIDRVLLWNYYAVPAWGAAHRNVAVWDKFGMPPSQPDRAGFDPMSWWVDPQKEKALHAR